MLKKFSKRLFGIVVYGLMSGIFALLSAWVFNIALPAMLNVLIAIVLIAFAIACLFGVYLELTTDE